MTTSTMSTVRRRFARLLVGIIAATFLVGCVRHQIYNPDATDYLRTVEITDGQGGEVDLAIIEFDNQGGFWKVDQMTDTLELIDRRNEESESGVLVVIFVHGWKNNADMSRKKGNLASFARSLEHIGMTARDADGESPDRVIGVYLGWPGDTSRLPVHREMTFWSRQNAANRMASYSMRETLFRVMSAAKSRAQSKCVVVGHSMGGLIVGETMSQSLTTLLLFGGEDGFRLPADLIVLQNPARSALAARQFMDVLKRSNAQVQLRNADGSIAAADGPMIVSITSQADKATSAAYAAGRSLGMLVVPFRGSLGDGEPSQRRLATRAEGHVDFIASHRARMEGDTVLLEPIAGAYNTTPYWIVQVTADVCASHSDLNNPNLGQLIEQILELNRVYDTAVQTWVAPAEPGAIP